MVTAAMFARPVANSLAVVSWFGFRLGFRFGLRDYQCCGFHIQHIESPFIGPVIIRSYIAGITKLPVSAIVCACKKRIA
jgi:hypothetical protein